MTDQKRPLLYELLLTHHLRECPPKPGTIVDVQVQHGDDCAFWLSGRMEACNCGPDIVSSYPTRGRKSQ